jgi:osmotically inducible lipoprotein OsmB
MYRNNVLMVGALCILSLTSCAHNPNRQQLGTLGGAVIGGAAGNVIGDGSALGTIGGAAAGALIGQELSRRPRNGRR